MLSGSPDVSPPAKVYLPWTTRKKICHSLITKDSDDDTWFSYLRFDYMHHKPPSPLSSFYPSFYFSNALNFQTGGGQNFKRRNVERVTFRNFKIAIIKITKNDSIVLLSNFFFFFLEIIWILEILNNFSSCEILIFQMVKSKK